ncbi:hypothetical protein [Knoellia sinensis]|uniref:hypothetical protein n=1 Tax=Knoellia sinensis TaxID=136100 RepID=UPI0014702AAD|nr:hypothetical protein [Knoellia sinensis]
METADGRRITLVAASEAALMATAAQIDAYAGQLQPLEPGEEPGRDQLPAVVEHAAHHIEKLVGGHDSYDVMTMLRQYLVPPDLALWSESGSSLGDSWAAAEVVALVLLGLGLPTRDPEVETPTASIVPELATSGAAVVQLAAINGITRYSRMSASADSSGGLTAMAFRLSSHETSVRGRQYPTVAAQINDAVLRTPQTATTFRNSLGFSYDDVIAVRHALVDLVGRAHEQAYAALALAAQAGGAPDATAQAAVEALFQTPSQLQQVTARQVADHAGLEPGLVETLLDRFSVRPNGGAPLELVRAFVDGRNPMAGTAMLSAPDRGYLPLPGAIALDEIRRTCEAPIKGTSAWTRYGRARDRAVEALVADILTAMLDDRAAVHRNLRYRESQAAHDLSATSTAHAVAPITEVDCLLVLDGVALCVEVKAGDLRPRTRQGGLAQLQGDLEKTVKAAASQADRLRRLIVDHEGLWLEDGTWLDFGDIQEIHSLVVCLDDLGPLALCTAELVRAGVLTQTQLPWVVSVHDLVVTQHVLNRPEHFLSYLRRRTNRDAALWVTGSDELDLLMWFLAGGFYFVPDPDRIHAEHPGSKPPTARMRREYSEQGRTQVGTFTDPLDAYYYWLDGSSSQEVACPRRGDPPPLFHRLIDTMRQQAAPGWWRVGADLDGYSTQAQEQMATNIETTLESSRRDGKFHTFTTGGTDDTGRWLYIFATGPVTPESRDHLRQYLAAKKHQQHADRALAVHLNPDGSPRLTLWLAYPPENDPELDRLARAMRLIPPDRAPDSIPPKAKAKAKAVRRKRRR